MATAAEVSGERFPLIGGERERGKREGKWRGE
jgi:hypothetical protein